MGTVKILSIITLALVVATLGYTIYANVKSSKSSDLDLEELDAPLLKPLES